MEIIGILPFSEEKNGWQKIINECFFINNWIINIEKISFSHFNNYQVDQVIEILNVLIESNTEKNIIINLEKIYSENELSEVEKIIKKFKKYSNVYYSYSDFGTYQLLLDAKIKRNIYHASTMITNYEDANLAIKENQLLIMGKEISREELAKIDHYLHKKIAIDVFGKFPIFYSKRMLLSNYFKYRKYDVLPNLSVSDRDYSLVEEFRNEEYPITEADETIVYEPFFYCLGSEINDFKKIGWITIYPQFLKIEEYIKILKIYQQYLDNDFQLIDGVSIEEKLSEIVPIYKGKLIEKTVLRK